MHLKNIIHKEIYITKCQKNKSFGFSIDSKTFIFYDNVHYMTKHIDKILLP
jgi:hypothetical protein